MSVQDDEGNVGGGRDETKLATEVDQVRRRTEAINDGKALAFYEVCSNAFVNSAMELDKSLLTLAAGAIGFSLGFVTPTKDSELLLMLYFLAVAFFLATIFATLGALKANTHHIEGIVRTGVATDTGSLLKTLDRIAIWSFVLGVILMTIVGACSVLEQRRSSKEMSDESKKLEEIRRSLVRVESLTESLHALPRLNVTPNPLSAPVDSQPKPVTPAPGTAGSLVPKMPGDK